MDIRNEHMFVMKELRDLFPKKVKIVYKYDSQVSVPCTIARPDISNINYDKFVGQNIITVNILIEDLLKIQAPMKGFLYIVLDRVEYQVESSIINSVFNNVIQLQCKLFKSDNS